MTTHKERVARSVLWAAWADAMGFMTELADTAAVTWRTGSPTVVTTVPWRRTIGGQFGAVIELPSGCYSDDTQLRLSTSRAIRHDGEFDVEAFARIEVPVFLNYALGAGRGTKTAAANLSRGGVAWCTNFFDNKQGRYVDGGGNGAAMRIQPHVWSAPPGRRTWSAAVIRNAVTTHGHIRAIAGACLHAQMLWQAMEGASLAPVAWAEALDAVAEIPSVVEADEELATLWRPEWERRSSTPLKTAVEQVLLELRDLQEAAAFSLGTGDPWASLVSALGADEAATRGTGTVSAVMAGALAWLCQTDARGAMLRAVNSLGTDTDTIATLAGALIGAQGFEPPPDQLQDAEYLRREAHRLSAVAQGHARTCFLYPDLLKWPAVRSPIDLVGEFAGALSIAGLGELMPTSGYFNSRSKATEGWQWCTLPYGQSVLVKRRDPVRPLPMGALRPTTATTSPVVHQGSAASQEHLFDPVAPAPPTKKPSRGRKSDGPRPVVEDIRQRTLIPSEIDLDTAVDMVVGSGFPEDLLGRTLIELALQPDGRTKASAFAVAIAQALRQRLG